MQKQQLSGTILKPRAFFRFAEWQAVEIRKLLCEFTRKKHVSSRPGFTDDAESLARWIERLARLGRDLPAAKAFDLAELVEHLLDELIRQIDALLAS